MEFRPAVLSLSHRFVFVHIPKTAGMTVRSILAPYCLQAERRPVRRLSSYLPVREDPRHYYMRLHVPAATIRRKLGSDLYGSVVSFAFVRNPFERLVSLYEFYTQDEILRNSKLGGGTSFKQFLRDYRLKRFFKPVDQARYVTDRSGRIIVDRICRFENLGTDLAEMLASVGIEPPHQLPHHNASKHGDYRAYYDEEALYLARPVVARDLDLFGYAFDSTTDRPAAA